MRRSTRLVLLGALILAFPGTVNSRDGLSRLSAQACPPLVLTDLDRQLMFIEGDGFDSTTTATVAGVLVSTRNVDDKCCILALPTLSAGPHEVVISTGNQTTTASFHAFPELSAGFLVQCLIDEIDILGDRGLIGGKAEKEIVKPLTRSLDLLQLGDRKAAHHQLSVNYLDTTARHVDEVATEAYNGLRGAMYQTILPALLREEDVLQDERDKAKKKIEDEKKKAEAIDADDSEQEALDTLEQDAKDLIDDEDFATTTDVINRITHAYGGNIQHVPLEICKCFARVKLSGAIDKKHAGTEGAGVFESNYAEVLGDWDVDFYNGATAKLEIYIECALTAGAQEVKLKKISILSQAGNASASGTGEGLLLMFTDKNGAENKWESDAIGALSNNPKVKGLGIGDVLVICFDWERKVKGGTEKCTYCILLKLVA